MSEPTAAIRTSAPVFAYLIVVDGDQAGAIFQLSDESTTIGRAGGNTVRLDDAAVSAEHLRILREANQFTLTDLGSENGAKVNGSPVQQHVMQHNDQIEVGRTNIVFKRLGPEA